MTEKWVLCPICGGKTRTKIRPDTEAKNLPIFCKICKNEFLLNVEPFQKCKDCSFFKNGCGFSKVDKRLNLDGDFEACGHFKLNKA